MVGGTAEEDRVAEGMEAGVKEAVTAAASKGVAEQVVVDEAAGA